jgi:hypothetical protein
MLTENVSVCGSIMLNVALFFKGKLVVADEGGQKNAQHNSVPANNSFRRRRSHSTASTSSRTSATGYNYSGEANPSMYRLACCPTSSCNLF